MTIILNMDCSSLRQALYITQSLQLSHNLTEDLCSPSTRTYILYSTILTTYLLSIIIDIVFQVGRLWTLLPADTTSME